MFLTDSYVWLLPAVAVVAALYASVGHGGASGYLALLALAGTFSPAAMSTTALLLNVLVAGIGTWMFATAGYLRWSMTWPFLATSIPLAFVGGAITADPHVYGLLLALTLAAAALRIAQTARTHGLQDATTAPPTTTGGDGVLARAAYPAVSMSVALPTGGAIGLVSGIVGVGGGIFLSPIMMLRRWGTARQIAATSAIFVLANSLAGLAGRAINGSLAIDGLLPFIIAAAVGGAVGSRLGAKHIDGVWLRYALAVVLLIAAVKSLLLVVG